MNAAARIGWCTAAVAVLGCGPPLVGTPPLTSAPPPSSTAPPATDWPPPLIDINGRAHRPAADPAVKAIALVFILSDCPIANSYLPELNRLHGAYAPRGVRLVLVHADPEITATQAREHAREYEIQPPVVLDPQHAWVRNAGVTIAPEAAVFDPGGKVLYRGRIDDQYVGLGKRRAQITSHDLANALEAVLAGRPVPQATTEAVGCFIPELKRGE